MLGIGGAALVSNGSRFSSAAGVGGTVDSLCCLKSDFMFGGGMLVGHPAETLLRT